MAGSSCPGQNSSRAPITLHSDVSALATASKGRMRSTVLATIAARGIASASAEPGSCTIRTPPCFLMAAAPAAPSRPMPVSTIPSKRGPNCAAAVAKRRSAAGRT